MNKRKVGLIALLAFVAVGTIGALKALLLLDKRFMQYECPLAREK